MSQQMRKHEAMQDMYSMQLEEEFDFPIPEECQTRTTWCKCSSSLKRIPTSAIAYADAASLSFT